MKNILIILMLLVSVVSGQTLDQLRQSYVNQQYGIFFCFNLVTWQNAEIGTGSFPANRFNPTQLNTGVWADAVVSSGARYAVLTTKHHDGFCLWPSAYTTYDVASSPYTGDVVQQFCDSMRSRGIKPILYYSIYDIHNGNDTTFIKNQLTELLANYGSFDGIWFDGWQWSVGYTAVPYATVKNHVKSLQPSCLIMENNHYHNYDSTEMMIYEKQIDGEVPANNTYYGELTETIRSDAKWFWNTGYTSLRTAAYIASGRQRSNNRLMSYLLAIQPDTFGVIPTTQNALLKSVDTLDNSIILYDSLTASTILTAGTYYLTSAVQTKNYPLYFDLRNGDIIIKPTVSSNYTFLHNGTAVCSTYTGTGKLIFTSANDDRFGQRIAGSTGTPDSSNVTYAYIYSTGTGSDYLYDVNCYYNYAIQGVLTFNQAADALTKQFKVKRANIRNCVVPSTGAATSYVGSYTNISYKIDSVEITDCSIDSTNHMSDPGAGIQVLLPPANSVIISGNYFQSPTVGTGSTASLRTYHASNNAIIKNNLFVATTKIPVGYFPIMSSGACTTWVYNNTFYGPNKSSGSMGEYLYGVSASGNVNYSYDNVWTNWENATNIRNHTVVRNKEVFYNNTANASAGTGNTVGTNAFTTQNPTFTTLLGPMKRVSTSPIPDGWVVGNSAIKKHGSRTVNDLGLSLTTNSFDGTKLNATDTITAGVWYTVQSSTTGNRSAAFRQNGKLEAFKRAYK